MSEVVEPLLVERILRLNRGEIAELLSKVAPSWIAMCLASLSRADAENFLSNASEIDAALIRQEMTLVGNPGAALLAKAYREAAYALGISVSRPNRWKSPFGIVIRRLWDLYRVESPAKSNDELALKQLGWAMRKISRPSLPDEFTVMRLMTEIAAALEVPSTEEVDRSLVASLPDLRVRKTITVLREDHYSGNEFEADVEIEEPFSLSDLRHKAGA